MTDIPPFARQNSNITRRTLARSAMAALAVASVPAIATGPALADSTMIALHAAFLMAVAETNGLPDSATNAELNASWQRGRDIADAAMVAPIETPADASAAIRLYTAIIDGCEPNDDDVAFLARIADSLAAIAQAGSVPS